MLGGSITELSVTDVSQKGSAVMYETTHLICAEVQLIRSEWGILAPQLS